MDLQLASTIIIDNADFVTIKRIRELYSIIDLFTLSFFTYIILILNKTLMRNGCFFKLFSSFNINI